jgi:hypothetical protein
MFTLQPGLHYPLVQLSNSSKQVVGLYTEMHVYLDQQPTKNLLILNSKDSKKVSLTVQTGWGKYSYKVYTCTGELVKQDKGSSFQGIMEFDVPVSGLIEFSFE